MISQNIAFPGSRTPEVGCVSDGGFPVDGRLGCLETGIRDISLINSCNLAGHGRCKLAGSINNCMDGVGISSAPHTVHNHCADAQHAVIGLVSGFAVDQRTKQSQFIRICGYPG